MHTLCQPGHATQAPAEATRLAHYDTDVIAPDKLERQNGDSYTLEQS